MTSAPVQVSGTWEDLGGGSVFYIINHGDISTHHHVRVLPFDTAGTALYTSAPAGTVTGIDQDMANFMSLLAACYGAAASASAYAVYQTTPDSTNELPYAHTLLSSSAFAAGTAAGVNWPTPVVADFVGKDAGGGRWNLALPGPAQGVFPAIGRGLEPNFAAAAKALADYLTRTTNGPITALKTGIVTHNGGQLIAPLSGVVSSWKRLRRRLGVA